VKQYKKELLGVNSDFKVDTDWKKAIRIAYKRNIAIGMVQDDLSELKKQYDSIEANNKLTRQQKIDSQSKIIVKAHQLAKIVEQHDKAQDW